MTEVFKLRSDAERFRWLGVRKTRMRPLQVLLEGAALRDSWQAPIVEEILDDELPDGPLSDFPYLDGVPVLSKRSVEALCDLIVESGELLPIVFPDAELYVYNVTNVVDALDEDRSTLVRFESSGRVMAIERFAFLEERLRGASIFKIPQMLRPLVLVTRPFVERVAVCGLTGFEFERVWPAP